MTTTIEILLFDGFDEMDAVGPYEMLENGAEAGADLTVDLVTRDREMEYERRGEVYVGEGA